MGQGENKTQPTAVSVEGFIAAVPDPRRRAEAEQIDAMMRRVTGESPRMWGPSIIGYGSYHYRYDSGREGDMCRIGFSPRKAQLVLYLIAEWGERQAEADALFLALGKHKTSVACLYVNKLGDVDLAVLEQLAQLSWTVMNARYPV
jgi:Domain of unknown function (DU1801)